MFELKLRPPPSRTGLVQRKRIIEQILIPSDTPVISLVAPSGYGKTTLMGQYQRTLDHPSAWLSIDATDSDPVVLLARITEALMSAGLLDAGSFDGHRIRSDTVITKGISGLAVALDGSSPGALLVDQVDRLTTQSAVDVIGAVMTKLSGLVQVIVASRSGSGLPLPRLRSQGMVTELTEEDLAMNEEEATEVFEAVGIATETGMESVMRTTEGWPVGVYLTAMAIKEGGPHPAEQEIYGDDFSLADYLKQELVDQAPEPLQRFLIKSSILTRLSGPLCDYVLETEGSAEALAGLKDANLLIVPMDRTRTWYRYHSLLRDFLLSELERQYPEEIAPLHSRAASWFEEVGDLGLAIDHVQAAGEGPRFVQMFMEQGRSVYAEGRLETLSEWLTWLEETKTIRDFPEVAAFGAYTRALEGDAGAAERLSMHAFTDDGGRPKEDSDLGPFALMLRSCQAARGVEQALTDARAAGAAFGRNAEWTHVCLGMEALALMAIEGAEAAEAIWTDALWRSESLGAHPFTSSASARRALAAMERGDWDAAANHSGHALELVRDNGLERYFSSAIVFTVAARLAAHQGHPEDARALMSRAIAIRPRLTVAFPLLSVSAMLEMSRAFIEIADIAGARRLMRDAADIIAVRPRLGLLVNRYEELKEKLASLPSGSVGPSSLTKAELRLLPLLVTHLTYPEIGDRLYVSRHTVKTQAMSIYRKLGVSSRAEAVEAARDIGLLIV